MPTERGHRGPLVGVAEASTRTFPEPNSSPRWCRGRWRSSSFEPDAVRPRARRLDHRRQLPRAGSDARAQRADRSRIPAVGDVRVAAAEGPVSALRRRRRHGGDVLHLQVDEDEPAAQCRATRSRSRRRSSRRTSRCRTSRITTSRPSTSRTKQENRFQFDDAELKKLLDPAVKAFFVVNPGNPSAIALSEETHREDRRDSREAAGPHPAHRRRLRHVRAGLPLAARRVPVQHDRRLLVQQVLRLHGLAPRRHRRARGQPVRPADREAPGSRAEEARQALRGAHARAPQRCASSTASSPTAATSRSITPPGCRCRSR